MPAAKRKSSSKSPRSKKAKEEVADALTENEISMQSEDTSDAKTEDQTVNGSGDDSVGVTENTEVASSNSNHEVKFSNCQTVTGQVFSPNHLFFHSFL